MRMNKFLSTLALAAGIAAISSVARAEEHSVVWTGVDFGPNAVYGYVGGFTGLNGQSIHEQGWLLRASGGYGRDRYDTPVSPSGHVTNHVTSGDLMFGYQALSGPASAKVFIGGDVENHRDTPVDPSAHLGTRYGVKTQMEMYTPLSENINLSALGNYSTAFQTYWSRVDTTYNIKGWFSIGPEVLFSGNSDYNQTRFGGAIGDIYLGPVSFRLDGGEAITHGRAEDGAYGGLSIGGAF